MRNLENTNPEVLQCFQDGGFVARRSEKHWAGLACDLTIEQALMRSLKTSDGLTRGTGFSDVQRSTWLLSKPVCSRYTQHMEDNTGVLYSTSEQHKTLRASRRMRDTEDTEKISKRLNDMSPFSGTEKLMNIMTGTVADASANDDDHYTIGESVIKAMSKQQVFQYAFKRSHAAKTMTTKVKIGKDSDIEIDPGLLFQRLLVLSHATTISNSEVFKYELCGYPPAIFESPHLLRKADKPQLVEPIVRYVDSSELVEESVLGVINDEPATTTTPTLVVVVL